MTLHDQTRDLARAYSLKAKQLDEAFLQTADSRAVQGGAICEQAELIRVQARKLNSIANEMVDCDE